MALGIICGVFWLVCGVGGAGLYFAEIQDKFPTLAKQGYREDLRNAWVFGLVGGPFALLTMLYQSDCKHGWRLK